MKLNKIIEIEGKELKVTYRQTIKHLPPQIEECGGFSTFFPQYEVDISVLIAIDEKGENVVLTKELIEQIENLI